MKLTLKSHALFTVLTDTLNFTSPAIGVPAIESVRLETIADTNSAGDTRVSLIGIATDRFVLGVSRVDADGDTGMTLMLSRDDAKNIARIAKTARKDDGWREVTIETNVTGSTATFSFNSGETVTINLVDVDFPRWRALLPANDDGMQLPTAGVAVDPIKLAKFAKVSAAKTNPMALFPQFKPNRDPSIVARQVGPITVKIGDDFIGLVMPVRASDSRNGQTFDYAQPAWLVS